MSKFAPKPVNHIGYGKYSGKTFEQVFDADPDYLKWMRDTTDPADEKNEGKYAKQNQARIKYINDLFSEGKAVRVGPEAEREEVLPKVAQVSAKTFETILKLLMSIEEKVEFLVKEKSSKEIETKAVEEFVAEDDVI